MTQRWWRAARVVCALAVALAACSTGNRAADPTEAQRPAATTTARSDPAAPTPGMPSAGRAPEAATAAFEPTECPFVVPEDYEVHCGQVTVPQARTGPLAEDAAETVALPVAVFRAEGAAPRETPLLYLDGGPGADTLASVTATFDDRFGAYAQHRDVILFDQRGTGFSTPSLRCPELDEVVFAQLDVKESTAAALAEQHEALDACRARVRAEGADVRHFNSVASALDVADLRRALGYEEWDLLGVSYGARLGQTILRLAPEGIRAAILDSVYPTFVDGPSELATRTAEAFDRFFSTCADDDVCRDAFPDLRDRFETLADRWDAAPVRVTVTDADGNERPALLDGTSARDLLFLSLYEPSLIATVPRFIADAESGDHRGFAALASISLDLLDSISIGVHISVQCHEEVAFADPAAVDASLEDHPELRSFVAAQLVDGPAGFETCRRWQAGTAEPAENLPVRSDVPVLVLAGELDPVTPVDWGRATAEGLGNARFVELSGEGHGVSLGEGCGAEIGRAFLAAPEAPLEDGCAEREAPVPFLPARSG